MKINFPTILGIIAVSVLCVFAVSMAIFDGNVSSTKDIDSSSKNNLEKNGEILYEINKQAIIYQTNNDQEKFVKQASLMQEKITEIARKSLGLNIFISDDFLGYYPLSRDSKVEITRDMQISKICNIAENIPLHLQKIRETKKFQLFAEKYFEYPIELNLQDERGHDSLFHYGLIANSDDGRTALTFFHVNTCTNQITDSDSYFLSCHEDSKYKIFGTINKDDILASLNHPDFCTIPLDSWRQSVYDYNQKIQEKLDEHMQTIESTDKSYESVSVYESEHKRLGLLRDISMMYVMDVSTEQEIEEKRKQYNNLFGPLPEEFLQILEKR